MERVSITERPDWREKAHEYGFNFHTMYGEPYWCEDAYYKLTLAQVEKLEEVTAELHQMCLKVVEKVIASDELMTKFRIPKHTWSFVRQSWLTHQPSLYSRLDLAWDGTGEPKLLENNADTPTSLYEAAFFQWIWLEDQLNAGQLPVGSDQFNSLQEKLIERFSELRDSRRGSVFFVEHGLSADELDALRGDVRESLRSRPLESAWWDQHDLPLLVAATEVGYR